jgi:hypothetical protein
MNFSEREGHKKITPNTLGTMSDSLKNDIWTVIHNTIDKSFISHGSTGYGDSQYRDDNAKLLWTKFFQKSISNLPYAGDYLREIEPFYQALKWNEVYDLIEFLLPLKTINHRTSLDLNQILQEHKAAYRVIDSIVQPISDKETIAAMESANNNSLSEEIREHLHKAERLYSNKQNPDFNSSCLESIKAVEGTCRVILNNNKILGDNIKKLNKSKNHSQHIISALEKINAFRGNDVAHAKKEDSHTTTREDAILIHTICCGFVNYFKSKETK